MHFDHNLKRRRQKYFTLILFIPPPLNPPNTLLFSKKSHHWLHVIFLENLEMAHVNNFVQEEG